jgi:Spy/CpxP family protein refolding chaperone
MQPFVTTMLGLAFMLGSTIPLAWTPLAFADQGCSGQGLKGSRPSPEMMQSEEGPRPWVHDGRGHRAQPVSLMLRWKDQLGLTPEQVSAIQTLEENFQRGAITRTAEIQLTTLDLQDLHRQHPLDLTKVEAQLRKIALLHVDQHMADIKLHHATKAVLTPDQQTALKQLIHATRKDYWGRRWSGQERREMQEPGGDPGPPMQ